MNFKKYFIKSYQIYLINNIKVKLNQTKNIE